LRERLAAEGLDWNWPALGPAADGPAPDRVEVVPFGVAERLAAEATVAVRASDPATAADRIGRLRDLDPEDPFVAARLAGLLVRGPAESFDPAAAVRFARRAVDGRPDLAFPHVALGLALYHHGEFRAAVVGIERG